MFSRADVVRVEGDPQADIGPAFDWDQLGLTVTV